MFSIHFDDREFRKLAKRLHTAAPKALQYTARDALNTAAFEARKAWQSEMQATFTLRNRWTVGSIRVEKARGLNLRTMQSRVGSALDYLETQEFGGEIRGRGNQGYRYPTKRAKPPGRVVRQRFRMARIQLTHPDLSQHASTRQKIAVAARKVRASGVKFAFLEVSGTIRGMYQLMGSKRRPKMRLLWDMTRGSVQIPKHATLEPAVERTRRRMPRYARGALLRQLKRARLA